VIINQGHVWPGSLNPGDDFPQISLSVSSIITHQRAGNHGFLPAILEIYLRYRNIKLIMQPMQQWF
jgi:hypothetical protein